jgi:hypothetical protein
VRALFFFSLCDSSRECEAREKQNKQKIYQLVGISTGSAKKEVTAAEIHFVGAHMQGRWLATPQRFFQLQLSHTKKAEQEKEKKKGNCNMVKIHADGTFFQHTWCAVYKKKEGEGAFKEKTKKNKKTTILATVFVVDSKRSDEQLAQDNELVKSGRNQASFCREFIQQTRDI